MCVVALGWRAHPRWQLIVAGNRDERHDRPASPLARWTDPVGFLAGRDLESGGTWLGVSEQGRFGVVTNLRGFGAAEPGGPSRGALVTDIVAARGDYADPYAAPLDHFSPFSLILIDGDRATYLANLPAIVRRDLGPGFYGLSNGVLDDPWPKTERLTAALERWASADAPPLESLFAALRESGPLPENPDAAAPDAPIFISNPIYGTRCSTIVTIDRDGVGMIAERRYSADGDVTGETILSFAWPPARSIAA